ncbi:DUF3071 domain-containing protein [Kocuria sp. JC486]|uniref:septation protein SepH n=1 Tax=Kocuria sp. JC486 TaxID=1970736 RepID=UPI00142292C4|nr:septation protein SepH [Kocuria sp. JC486]NHU84363.1 DUF3071 domain-containing protein [Kocuria sp. JC486]
MDELRLVGVHDDGEHLVVETPDGGRHLLRIDQHLRGTVQRARRVAPRRQGTQAGDFGPRDIQARFRAGATVDEIVEESGWEAARVRRYEWPILAERAHIAREAQKVEVVARTSRSGAYRSVFDGEAQSLSQIVMTHAAQLGVATTSLDWDAWQRPDQQWQVSARFRVANPDAAPRDLVDQEPSAQWIFNPASLTVTPDNGWASSLTASPQAESAVTGSDSLFGAPSSRVPASVTPDEGPVADDAAPEEEPSNDDADGSAVDAVDDSAEESTSEATGRDSGAAAQNLGQKQSTVRETASAQETDELLDVLDARRGQRLGHDAQSDDQLAEILGRSMGHVSRHPRPISAPQNSTLFDRPVNPAHPAGQTSAQQSSQQAPQDAEPDSTQGSTPEVQEDTAEATAEDGNASEESAGATIHHLGRADDQDRPDSPVVEITDTDSRPLGNSADAPTASAPASNDDAADAGTEQHEATVTPLRGAAEATTEARSDESSEDSAADQPAEEAATTEQATTEQAPTEKPAQEKTPRPRPRGRAGAKRSRSSVPSWDEIVFGAKNDDN